MSSRAGPNHTLHRTRPPELLVFAHLAFISLFGAAAGPVSFYVRVRHEVAGGIVTPRCHQRFCPLYPIGTCVSGNGEVRSSRDNVPLLFGVVVEA
jgi:hypothetical protein